MGDMDFVACKTNVVYFRVCGVQSSCLVVKAEHLQRTLAESSQVSRRALAKSCEVSRCSQCLGEAIESISVRTLGKSIENLSRVFREFLILSKLLARALGRVAQRHNLPLVGSCIAPILWRIPRAVPYFSILVLYFAAISILGEFHLPTAAYPTKAFRIMFLIPQCFHTGVIRFYSVRIIGKNKNIDVITHTFCKLEAVMGASRILSSHDPRLQNAVHQAMKPFSIFAYFCHNPIRISSNIFSLKKEPKKCGF